MNLNELRLLLAEKIAGSEFAGRTCFAGGCVRDSLLGRTSTHLDADIAVELQDGGARLALYLQGKLPTSIPELHRGFGTAKSWFGDIQLDFVMTRAEKYFPGSRHPRVIFADLSSDCQRRDFTVNALYQELINGDILDPSCRGQQDLKSRILRCVQDPRHSLKEDPLRILRAIRFAVVLGFSIEPDTFSAIRENAHLILSLSSQRCHDEIEKLDKCVDKQGKHAWVKLLETAGISSYLEKRSHLS